LRNARKRQIIQLSKQDRSSLAKILSKAKSPARKQIRGRILDLIARKEHPATIAEILPVGIAT